MQQCGDSKKYENDTITQIELAKLAGVSQATVHRALSGSTSVSGETRQKIMEMAQRHSYRLNTGASMLRSGKTQVVGILVWHESASHMANLPSYEYVVGITDCLTELNYKTILLRHAQLIPEDESELPVLFRENCMDGLICTYGISMQDKNMLEKLELPMVWLDANHQEDTNSLWRDEVHAAKIAAERLIALGHKVIAYIDSNNVSDGDVFAGGIHASLPGRLDGYVKAMRAANLEPHVVKISSGNPVNAQESIADFLIANRDVTACVCYSVDQAFWTNHAALKVGMFVPSDLSLISCDETHAAMRYWPDMGRVSFDRYGMGRKAAKMLIKSLKDGKNQFSEIEKSFSIRGNSFGPTSPRQLLK